MSLNFVVSQGTILGGLIFAFEGNGVSASIEVDLSDTPFQFNFNKKFPVALAQTEVDVHVSGTVDPSFTATLTLNKSILTVTLNKPLPSGDGSFLLGSSPGVANVQIGFFVYGSI